MESNSLPNLFQTYRLRVTLSTENRRPALRFPSLALYCQRQEATGNLEPAGDLANVAGGATPQT
ncbi:hypothetical protein [Solitalea lacus]|uniref:hypothetical protein n=1 Tax=Solitalea lacus TaxID=2911172 RepID=UPI001EDABD51|nr:hypothetical protein [Solitalea lacus]UKJ06947.1 hypothetical protein L2B55_15625 [Solitalea lacus]